MKIKALIVVLAMFLGISILTVFAAADTGLCNSDGDCNDGNSSTFDQCINPGTVISECRNILVNCASDLDCGGNVFVDGSFCSNGDTYRNFLNSTCVNPGVPESFCIAEVSPQLVEMCTVGCSDGMCTVENITCNNNLECDDGNNLTFDQCINAGTVTSECRNTEVNCFVDSDCGTSGFIGGEFCSNGNVSRLFQSFSCNNGGTTDSFCVSEVNQTSVQMCTSGCDGGLCIIPSICGNGVLETGEQCDDNNFMNGDGCSSSCNLEPIACNFDVDCDDNQTLTFDQCINGGTVASECSHTSINCASDLDCGSNGFVGGGFCSNNSVTKLFQTFSCQNAGTMGSFCNNSLEQQTINVCSSLCSQGVCVQPTCSFDSDCNDNTNSTIDMCINPGTVQSSCSHEDIIPPQVENLSVSITRPTNNERIPFNQSIPLAYDITRNASSCSYLVDSSLPLEVPGCLNTTFSTSGGSHNITVIVIFSDNSSMNDTHSFFVDLSPPNIILESPINGSMLNSTAVLLKFTASDQDGINYCDIWNNFGGTFVKERTLTNISSGVEHSISYNLPNGGYKWNVFCLDEFSHGTFAASDYVFNVVIPQNVTPSGNGGSSGGGSHGSAFFTEEERCLYEDCRNVNKTTVYYEPLPNVVNKSVSSKVLLNEISGDSYESGLSGISLFLIIFLALGIILLILLIVMLSKG
ncbi:MAG: hypothetical protein Q7S74_01650 [Nanoarchaeota archaeon]|nr:hypothetical protein [Nanoarchaeota archaeon]